MKRSDLVQRLHEINSQLQYKDAEQSVSVILDGISNALSNGGRAEIRGFGSFVLSHRPPRTGRNPKSGEAVKVPAKYVPHFRPGKELKERVDYL